MNVLLRFPRRVAAKIRQNIGLVALFWVMVVAQALVPVGHMLGRADLLPWIMATLSAAVLLRVRGVGEGPHPQLSRPPARLDGTIRSLALGALPWVLLLAYDGVRLRSEEALVGVGLGLFGLLLFFRGSSRFGRTAWNPGVVSIPVLVIGLSLLGVLLAGGLGWFARAEGPTAFSKWTRPALVGLAFLAVSIGSSHPRDLSQRLRAGRRDGSPYRVALFRPGLALLGPAVGLWLLLVLLEERWSNGVDFSLGFVGSLHVVAWAAVLWPRPEPVAVGCLLHEVVPAGGADPVPELTALPFDRPPSGALRLNPLHVRRTRSLHPWLVPVRAARIDSFDDPIRPLWPPRTAPAPQHILGNAGFELDPRTQRPQYDTITLHLRSREDMTTVAGGEAQTRRIYVLRAFPPTGGGRRSGRRTYRWDEPVPTSTLVVVDASTETVELTTGSILILSTEGVARAYEVEIGRPIYAWEQPEEFRPPQLEDYAAP